MTELSGSGPEAKDMKLVRTKGHAGEIFQVRKVVVSLSKIDFITKKAHGKPVCLFCIIYGIALHFNCTVLYLGDRKRDFVKSRALLKSKLNHAIILLDQLEFGGVVCK